MKLFLKHPFYAIFFLLFLSSCEYENTELYEHNANKNIKPPEIQTVKLELNEDTLYLYQSRFIHFKFQSNSIQKIVAVKFYLDNTLLKTVNEDEGFFNLNYDQLIEGIHKIKIELYTKTGTGSIADIIGSEVFVFNSSKEWIIKVERYYYSNTIQLSEQNGFLKLSWPKSNSGNFKSFIIYLNNKNNYTTQNDIIDSTYYGQEKSYTVYVETKDGKQLYWGSTTLSYNLPQLSLEVSNKNEYKIIWNKSKYYNAIKTYNLYIDDNLIKSTEDCNDTSENLTNMLFGDYINLKLKITPKLPNEDQWFQPYSSFSDYLGFRYSLDRHYDNIKGINNNEFIFNNFDSIFKFSLERKKIIQRTGYQMKNQGCYGSSFVRNSVSPFGNYISAYSGCDELDILINSNNLEVVNTINLQSIRNQYPLGTFISDNGLGIVNSGNGGFYLYDFINELEVAHHISGRGLQISSNGDYILLQNGTIYLVQCIDSTFKPIWNKPSNMTSFYFKFSKSNPNQLALWDGSIFSIRQCSNFSPIYEFPLVNEVIVDIDFLNNELLTTKTGHLLIRDLQNGTLIKDIQTNSPYSYSCCLLNHNIISDKGIIYFAY